jgi:hypothetical protein
MFIRNPRISYVGAGDQGGGQGGDGGQGAAGASGAESGQGAGAPTPTPPAGETPEQKIARLEADNARLNREKADARIAKEGELKAKARRDQLVGLATGFGIEVKDSDTAEEIQAKITGKATAPAPAVDDATQKAALLDAAVAKAAWRNKVDPAQGDYLEFKLAKAPGFSDLDPKAADFTDKLDALVKSVTKDDPVFGTGGTGPGAAGGEQHGGPGGSQTNISVDDFKGMTVTEKSQLFQTNRALFDKLSSEMLKSAV